MEHVKCPNYKVCQLTQLPHFETGTRSRKDYMIAYCDSEEQGWKSCRRFILKQEMGFCPDFVLPDSNYSLDEVILMFDETENNNIL